VISAPRNDWRAVTEKIDGELNIINFPKKWREKKKSDTGLPKTFGLFPYKLDPP
jgi:hypothetical protein